MQDHDPFGTGEAQDRLDGMPDPIQIQEDPILRFGGGTYELTYDHYADLDLDPGDEVTLKIRLEITKAGIEAHGEALRDYVTGKVVFTGELKKVSTR